MNATTCTQLEAGSRFTYGGVSWVVLEQRHDAALCLAKDVLEVRAFDDKARSDYASSTLRRYLNSDFLNMLEDAGADMAALLPMPVEYTIIYDMPEYEAYEDTVHIHLLSRELYYRLNRYIPKVARAWWTCTPFCPKVTKANSIYFPFRERFHYIRTIDPDGAVDREFPDDYLGVRPLCNISTVLSN